MTAFWAYTRAVQLLKIGVQHVHVIGLAKRTFPVAVRTFDRVLVFIKIESHF